MLVVTRRVSFKGWTQGDLAAELGVTQPAVGKWLNGQHMLPLDKAKKLASLTGMDVNTIADVFIELHKAAHEAKGASRATTHGSPELDADAAKLEAMGADPGPTLEDIIPLAAAAGGVPR
jgi:transcriptional regulator with XRE-family HTH domain